MEIIMKKLALLLIVSIAPMSVQAEQLVKEFRGTGNTTTATFTVDDPWLLDWRLDGDYDAMIALDIALIEASTGRHVGRVLHTKPDGTSYESVRRWRAGRSKLSKSSPRRPTSIHHEVPTDPHFSSLAWLVPALSACAESGVVRLFCR
jgi:hypothetical protein